MRRQLAFVVMRRPEYRTLGPVAEAALGEERWRVTLILVSAALQQTEKAYQIPTLDNVPARLQGRCRAVVTTPDRIAEELAGADVIVSTMGRPRVLGSCGRAVPGALWCAVFDADHSAMPDHAFHDAELVFWPSRYYLDWAVEQGVAPRELLELRSHFVGYARGDALAWSSRAATRHAWGIREDRPAVLYIPDEVVLTQGHAFVTDWYRHVWCVDHRWERIIRAIVLRRTRQALREAVAERGSHAETIRALRLFCDRHRAQLVMMPRRRKHWVRGRGLTRQESAMADAVVPEDEQYPQTLPKAAQMADLVICSYCSGSILDALAAGVPYVTVAIPPCGREAEDYRYDERFRHEPGHWPGATWHYSADEFIERFPHQTLAGFALDDDVLAEARARYVGPVDGRCSQRILTAIRARIEGRGIAQGPGSPGEAEPGTGIQGHPLVPSWMGGEP